MPWYFCALILENGSELRSERAESTASRENVKIRKMRAKARGILEATMPIGPRTVIVVPYVELVQPL